MSFTAHIRRCGLGLAALSVLALYGCASNGVEGGVGGSQDAGIGSGGSSSNGSGGNSSSGGSKGSGSGGALGSGGSSAGSGGHTSIGTGGASTGSGGATGAGGSGPPHCNTSLLITAPLGNIEAGADATVRLRVSANESPLMMLMWAWTVSDPNGNALTPTVSSDDDTAAEFPVIRKGSYQVTATPSGDTRCMPANFTVDVVDPEGPSFNFRASASGYPSQDRTVKLSDLSNQTTLVLEAGKPFTVKPMDALNNLLNTYVRISSSNQAFTFEGNTTTKPVTTSLLATQNYNFLIAPMDSELANGTPTGDVFAPFLQSSMPGVWSSQKLYIDQGTQVMGQTLTAGGAPLQNARMQLRSTAGTPSTIGYSDAAGVLSLWVRDGKLSAVVIPPDGSGLPVATTAAGAIASASGAFLTMQWAATTNSTLTVQVQTVDGSSPVANAQVRLASSGMGYSAGTLTVQSPGADDLQVATTASVTASLQTAKEGYVTFPPVPPGLYTLTIIPPATAAPAAVTTMPITLTAGTMIQTIALARKTSLKAIVTTPAGIPAAGAQVTAIDIGNACTASATGCPGAGTPATGTSAATGSVFSGQVDTSGTFVLTVDPDRTYEVIIQPSGVNTTLGRAVRPAFRLCSTATAPCIGTNGDGSMPNVTLPVGTQYQGQLNDTDGLKVGGASIQVFCGLASATCDPNVSLAEATSTGDGTFSVVLPVPASTSSALNK